MNSKPSTSGSNWASNNGQSKKFEPKIPSKLSSAKKDSGHSVNSSSIDQGKPSTSIVGNPRPPQASQMISSSSNRKEMFKDEQSILFDDFKDNLLNVNNHNSTFQSQVVRNGINGTTAGGRGVVDAVNISGEFSMNCTMFARCHRIRNFSDDSLLRQLEKLQLQLQTKEAETLFVRNQWQQAVIRAEQDKVGMARQLEEQANQHRSQANQYIKKEENLRTQLEFQVRPFDYHLSALYQCSKPIFNVHFPLRRWRSTT